MRTTPAFADQTQETLVESAAAEQPTRPGTRPGRPMCHARPHAQTYHSLSHETRRVEPPRTIFYSRPDCTRQHTQLLCFVRAEAQRYPISTYVTQDRRLRASGLPSRAAPPHKSSVRTQICTGPLNSPRAEFRGSPVRPVPM